MNHRLRCAALVLLACVGSVVALAAPASAVGSTVHGIHFRSGAPVRYGDPGFAHFGHTYYVYGTSQGAGFPVASSSRYNGTYTSRGAVLKDPPSWVGTAPTLGKRMWAPEVFRVNAGHRWKYVLYYSAWDHSQRRNCIGVATSSYPTHGFHPAAGPICAPRGEPSRAEAIDPTYFVSNKGHRYMIFKTSLHNRSAWKIWALPMDGSGVRPTGALPRVKLTPRNRMESPFIVHSVGKIWLFVSRNWYNQCNYVTQAWSAPEMWSGSFTYRRTLLAPSTTGEKCGNGGASMFHAGGALRTVFFSHGSSLHSKRHDDVATIWFHTAPYVG